MIVSFCTLRNSIKNICFPRVCGNSVFSSFWILFFKFKKLYLYSLVLIYFIMLKYILYIKDNVYTISHKLFREFSAGSVVKNESPCQWRRCRFDPWVGKILWRRKWQPTPVFLLEKSYGQRSLVGYIPWVAKSWIWLSDRTYMHAWNISFLISPLFLVLHCFFSLQVLGILYVSESLWLYIWQYIYCKCWFLLHHLPFEWAYNFLPWKIF